MGSIPVLIVERNPTLLRLITWLLETFYWAEVCVVGACAKLDDVWHLPTKVDPKLALIGVGMHHADDLERITVLRRYRPDMRIIVYGPADLPCYRTAALKLGVDGYFAREQFNTAFLPLAHALAPMLG